MIAFEDYIEMQFWETVVRAVCQIRPHDAVACADEAVEERRKRLAQLRAKMLQVAQQAGLARPGDVS